MDQTKTKLKGPQHILVNRKEESPTKHQVKRDFGDQRKKNKSADIVPQIARVHISFHDQKCKNRKSETANIVKPLVSGDDGAPQMIAQHKGHGKNMQCGRTEVKSECFHRANPFFKIFTQYNTDIRIDAIRIYSELCKRQKNSPHPKRMGRAQSLFQRDTGINLRRPSWWTSAGWSGCAESAQWQWQ